jgi:hypothetical protein
MYNETEINALLFVVLTATVVPSVIYNRMQIMQTLSEPRLIYTYSVSNRLLHIKFVTVVS